MKVKIIGLGGIGSVLSGMMARYLFYSCRDRSPEMTFIDGDSYEEKNRERQDFTAINKNKADIKAKEISIKFKGMVCSAMPEYLTQRNISDIIEDDDIVMMCVDNHKTRKVVSDYCKTLKNIVLISGGNELTDGNVQMFVKQNGVEVTPDLCHFHDEIANPDDKSPDEMSCEELSVSEPQLFFTNAGVAVFMCFAFWNIVIEERIPGEETYFDMKLMAADTKKRVGLAAA